VNASKTVIELTILINPSLPDHTGIKEALKQARKLETTVDSEQHPGTTADQEKRLSLAFMHSP